MGNGPETMTDHLGFFTQMQKNFLWETGTNLDISFVHQPDKFGKKSLLGVALTEVVRELDGHPDDWKQFEQSLDCKSSQSPIRIRFQNDTICFPGELELQPIITDNKFSGFRGILKDISQITDLENELSCAHKRFDILFDSIPVISSISRIDNFTYENVNEEFLNFQACQKSEFIGQTMMAITHWDSPDTVKKIVADLLEGNKPEAHVSQIVGVDRKTRTSRAKSALLPYPDQQRLLLFSSDISGELAETELIAKNEILNATLESMLQGVTLLDDNLDLVFCNSRFLALLDFPDELDKPGTNLADFIRYNAQRGEYGPGDVEEQVKERVDLALQFVSHKFDRTREDGSVLEIEGHYVPNVGFLTTYTDITDRVKAEEEIRNNEKLLRDVIDSIPFAFSLWNTETELVLTNSVWGEWYPELKDLTYIGVKLEDQIRRGLANGYTSPYPDDPEAYIADRIDRFRNPPENMLELQKYGNRWHHVINKKLTSGGTVGIRIDVTESHDREEQLKQAQKMEAVGQLTGGIAHDFNNLLAVILGNAEMLEEENVKFNNHSSHQISAIMKSALRGSELTQRLLSFSRKFDLLPKVMNLNTSIKEMLVLLKSSISESIRIKTDIKDDLWLCFTDPGQIENCLLNLCLNARDAMPDGGVIVLKTENIHLNAIKFKLEDEPVSGDFVRLSVSDTGEGIPEENLDQIFEPFYTTKEVGKGSGLGLSMVFGFVKQSNGYLSVESKIDQGTIFNIFLPRQSS